MQRSSYSWGDLGFSGLKKPTGYGSVSLRASVCGIDIGDAWSKKTTYSEGTEHAEDAVADYVETLEGMYSGYFGFVKPSLTEQQILQAMSQGTKTITIVNLTASPCSTTLGTCTKPDLEGCAERLIRLADNGWTISVQAHHYYQPKGVSDAKAKSIEAHKAMTKKGITMTVSNP